MSIPLFIHKLKCNESFHRTHMLFKLFSLLDQKKTIACRFDDLILAFMSNGIELYCFKFNTETSSWIQISNTIFKIVLYKQISSLVEIDPIIEYVLDKSDTDYMSLISKALSQEHIILPNMKGFVLLDQQLGRTIYIGDLDGHIDFNTKYCFFDELKFKETNFYKYDLYQNHRLNLFGLSKESITKVLDNCFNESFDHREGTIFNARFPIFGGNRSTFKQLAEELSISKEYARKLQERYIKRLKRYFRHERNRPQTKELRKEYKVTTNLEFKRDIQLDIIDRLYKDCNPNFISWLKKNDRYTVEKDFYAYLEDNHSHDIERMIIIDYFEEYQIESILNRYNLKTKNDSVREDGLLLAIIKRYILNYIFNRNSYYNAIDADRDIIIFSEIDIPTTLFYLEAIAN